MDFSVGSQVGAFFAVAQGCPVPGAEPLRAAAASRSRGRNARGGGGPGDPRDTQRLESAGGGRWAEFQAGEFKDVGPPNVMWTLV